ncbi:hypothetical protein [Alkalicoccobacillus plakortidis]|uniref:AAA domain-containing protein n=1 Tax=Alkalicoccobacillus plakortidis TaxID=444060 RepID=A0ABT0XIY3_9BACI|nr:hypothetical protein [Alkalicoccobacillus plakortidis]MCM2675871.1 hypothetical protein [Alkalicoccobacillus plakortidis]
MEKKSKNILRAWWLTELLQMPTIDDKDSSMRHIQREGLSKLPWEEKQEDKGEGYYVFIGLTPLKSMMEFIRDAFRSQEEFHQYTNEKTFLALIKVGADGSYERGSLQIPYISGILGELGKSQNLYDSYHTTFQNMHNDLQIVFNENFGKGSISLDVIQYMLETLIQSMNYPESLIVNKQKGYLFECVVKKLKKNEMPYFMNSFYSKDIEKVLSNGLGKGALKQYVKGTDVKTDIDENRVLLTKWLDPKYISPVRWPSPDHHLLTTMQQVAVNVILHDEQFLHSVNGPPGTGKTTLLKDLFAANIYNRAKAMSAFKKPYDAFKPIKSETESRKGFRPHESIAKYGMVVSSSK